jgi:NTE family protein
MIGLKYSYFRQIDFIFQIQGFFLSLMFSEKYKTGLVLSGGAARGFAHLGVLKALEELNLRPDIISGASAGAIAGAFYADGYHPAEILELLTHKKIYEYFRITIPKTGFFKVQGLVEVLKKNLRAKTFEELSLPLVITVTNLNKGIPEYIQSGNLIEMVIASASIPVFIETKKINNTFYIDGGIMDNLPLYPIQKKCRKLIGVHVNPVGDIKNHSGLVHLAERAFHLAIAAEIDRKKALFDYFIEPQKLQNYGLLDIHKGEEIYKVGYEAAKNVIRP